MHETKAEFCNAKTQTGTIQNASHGESGALRKDEKKERKRKMNAAKSENVSEQKEKERGSQNGFSEAIKRQLYTTAVSPLSSECCLSYH